MIRNLLCVAFFLLAVLQANSQSAYGPLQWENDVLQLEKLDSAETYSPDAVLFAGSSSIRLWSTITEDMAPYEVIRRGYGGAKLTDFVMYVDRIVSPHPCRAVVIFIANDITGNSDDITPQEVAMLFNQMVTIIRQSHPATPVFWIEVTPTPSRWQVWSKAYEAGQLIKQACLKMSNVHFISTRNAFLDNNGKPEAAYFMPDMLHLNDEGYKVWSRIIRAELERKVGLY